MRDALPIYHHILARHAVDGRNRSCSRSEKATDPKPTIVLFYGAFAGALCWNAVVSHLFRDGDPGISAANPSRCVKGGRSHRDTRQERKRTSDPCRRPLTMTSMPSLAKALALARSISVDAPIMTAIFPCRRSSMLSFFGIRRAPRCKGKTLHTDLHRRLSSWDISFRESRRLPTLCGYVTSAQLNRPAAQRDGDRMSPIVDIELFKNAAQMGFYRIDRNR